MPLGEPERRCKSLKKHPSPVFRPGAVGYQEDVLPADRDGFVSHPGETHIHAGGVPGRSVHTVGRGMSFARILVYLFIYLF